jgi:putative membrane protein
MWDWSYSMNGWWMVLGGIMMVVFWGGLILLVVWGIKKLTERPGGREEHTPLDIAKERYAKGEISKEQFEQIKKDLY